MCFRALSEECRELKRIGDIKLLNQLRDAGVALFYHISSVFTDEATSYPPLKQLFTTCIEMLGQVIDYMNILQCKSVVSCNLTYLLCMKINAVVHVSSQY